MPRNFSNVAKQSCQVYLDYLFTQKEKAVVSTGVSGIEVYAKDKRTNITYVNFKLSKKLHDISFVELNIGTQRFENSSYSGFSILSYDELTATVSASLAAPVFSALSMSKLNDISFVSDMRFLIKRVFEWYDNFSAYPNLWFKKYVVKTDNKICFRVPTNEHFMPMPKNFCHESLSDDQWAAVSGIFNAPLSYVWGAPGTGKTRYVLSHAIATYFHSGNVVLVTAPTNNAVEQTLRGIIEVFKNLDYPIENIRRLGTPTESFLKDYPEVCGSPNRNEIIRLQKIINILRICSEFYIQTSEHISALDNLLPTFFSRRDLSEAKSTHDTLLQKLSLEKQSLQDDIDSFTIQYHSLCNSMPKHRSFFNKRLYDDYASQKDVLSKQLADAEIKMAKLTSDYEQAIETNYHLSSLTKYIDSHEREFNLYRSLKIPPAHYASMMEQLDSELQELIEADKQADSNILVYGATIDHVIANLTPDKNHYAHVFLDEAAYCPLVKATALLAYCCPVTLLGDHMQLPPICEMSKDSIVGQFNETNYFSDRSNMPVFLWDLSAVYIEDVLSDISWEEFLVHYIKNTPDFDIVPKYDLISSYRFGEALANVLRGTVYSESFKGNPSIDTQVTVLHAPTVPAPAPRRSMDEVLAIKEYLSKNNLQDFAVLTPYTAQRQLLKNNIPELHDGENLLTIHGSQGREWDTVILSVVDAGKNFFMATNNPVSHGKQVINTAISRARKNLVVVCNTSYWGNLENELIGKLVRTALK